MHILLVTPAFAENLGGGERYVYRLAHQLATSGHSISVVTSNAREELDYWHGRPQDAPVTVEDLNGIQLIRCSLPGFKGGQPALHAWRKSMVVLSTLPSDQSTMLSRMARHMPPINQLTRAFELAGPVDLIHGFNLSWEHTAICAWEERAQRSVPFVITPFAHVGTGRPSRNISMDHQRRLLMNADNIQALSPSEKEGLILWDVPEERITVVGSGYDEIPPESAALNPRHVFGLEGRFALFIGRLTYDKGAIHAAEAILRSEHDTHPPTLVLVGTMTPEFNRFYEQLTPAQKQLIRPLGRLSEAYKHALLHAADMLLLPSRADALGIVLLEAWSHRKPVIGARAGGIPGIISDGEDGLLIPFGNVARLSDAMTRLFLDEHMRREMGQLGHLKLASEFSWHHVVSKVLAGYDLAQHHFRAVLPALLA